MSTNPYELSLEDAEDLVTTEPRTSLLWRAAHTIVQLYAALATYDGAIVLHGWRCKCFTWNSDEKEHRQDCRACGKKRPPEEIRCPLDGARYGEDGCCNLCGAEYRGEAT